MPATSPTPMATCGRWPTIPSCMWVPGDDSPVAVNKKAPGVAGGQCQAVMVSRSLFCYHLINRGGAADFVAHHQQGLAVRGILGVDEDQSLRAQIPGGGVGGAVNIRGLGEIPVVDVADRAGGGGIGDVEHHDAPGALEADKGVLAALEGADGESFRLRALVVAAVVEAVVCVGGVEAIRIAGGGQLLQGIPRVVHLAALGVPDADGASTVAVQFVEIAVVVDISFGVDHIEPAEVGVGPEG